MMNHIISECSRLSQKEYKKRNDWVGKMIQWELCKKFKFYQTNKCYMNNQESLMENETHKILSDFGIQIDHRISARRPVLMIVKKKKNEKENLPKRGLCRAGWPQSKIERKLKEG